MLGRMLEHYKGLQVTNTLLAAFEEEANVIGKYIFVGSRVDIVASRGAEGIYLNVDVIETADIDKIALTVGVAK
jgi:hypothetical protein